MRVASTTSVFYKIPPKLPFLKGGTPLFIKEGVGEIVRLWRFFLIAGLIVLSGCAGINRAEQTTDRPLTDEMASGIKIERIHPSAAGQMLDMRYRVVDQEKAKGVMKRGAQIYLVDQSNGARLSVPDMAMVGKLLQRPDQGDNKKVFWIFFSNPGAMVKPGARVTLVIDEIRIKDILVQ
jgi:hypothetical protein